MGQYTIQINDLSGNIIFSGTFVTNSSNIVTELYNDVDSSTNILIGLNGINPTPNTYGYGFDTNDYTYSLDGGASNTIPYDNGYLSTWQQFDPNGIIIKSIPLYDTDPNTYFAYNITSHTFQNHTPSNNDPASSNVGSIVGLSASANNVYLDTVTFTIGIIIPPGPPPIPISNICFLANTPVRTNQGRIAIQYLQPGIHTIRNKPILAITRTVHTDPHLVCFEKHALGSNYPAERTIMSKNHRIKYRGVMIPAKWFVNNNFSRVHIVPYTGEILYNVILQNHTVMRVNNMMVETLHPNNVIARLYLKSFTEDQRRKLITDMNSSLLNKNAKKYRRVVRAICAKNSTPK